MSEHLVTVTQERLASVITMGVRQDGNIHISAAGIEPEHARALLTELDTVRHQLIAFLASREVTDVNVIPIRR